MSEQVLTLGIMQPYIFPYIGYFQYIAATDLFVLYDDVAFIKQGWVNRNRILLNGTPYTFTVPVSSISSFRKIRETSLHEHSMDKWKKTFKTTLFHAYNRAPNYPDIAPLIESIVMKPHKTIAEFATASIVEFCSFLEIKTNLILNPDQFKNAHLQAQERIIDICKQTGAKKYINPIGGVTLYTASDFMANGIELKFIKSKLPEYLQYDFNWVPSLSIIDVLMFNTKFQVQEMLNEYTLL